VSATATPFDASFSSTIKLEKKVLNGLVAFTPEGEGGEEGGRGGKERGFECWECLCYCYSVQRLLTSRRIDFRREGRERGREGGKKRTERTHAQNPLRNNV